jgi:hypothetical protein
MEGTILAHNDGNVPTWSFNSLELAPVLFGQLVYFFEKACGISAICCVNLDQPVWTPIEVYVRAVGQCRHWKKKKQL